ncbi:MAG TPA: thioredoxin family protein [Mucilaginibacter sp.]
MKKIKLLFVALLLTGSAAFAQTDMPSSETVLNNAYAQAAKENKKVLLMFHASWCGWCKKMDASLNDPTCKKFFDDNYVVAHLDIMEQAAKKSLENPGAVDVLTKLTGAKEVGLPYWVILDSKGNTLANSLMGKNGLPSTKLDDNIGCPATEQEVTFFDNVLKKTSSLKAEDIAVIHKRFLLNQPPPAPAKGTN